MLKSNFNTTTRFASLLALLLIFSSHATAGDSTGQWTDTRDVRLSKPILKRSECVYIEPGEFNPAIYPGLKFSAKITGSSIVPPDLVTKKLLLRFNIYNSADTAEDIYFFPGIYYTAIKLYRVNRNVLQALPENIPPITDGNGFRALTLKPNDSLTVVAELSFLKTYINSVRPRLVHPAYAQAYLSELRSSYNQDNVITYIFCGLLLMMILFSAGSYLQGGGREFLFYSFYAFFLGSMLLTKAVFVYRMSQLSYLFESYLDYIFQCVGIIFYMLFMQQFLGTSKKHPFLHRFYRTGILLLLLSMLLYTILHFFSNNYPLENTVETVTKVLLLIMILIFLVYSLRHWDDKLLRYLFWGNLLLFIFAVLSQAMVMADNLFSNLPGIFGSSLFYYELGLLLELVFFLLGLNYKNRKNIIAQTREREKLKAENRMKEYEKELAVLKAQQTERERISADMHDELGSGMTAIRLMSEIARNKMQGNVPAEIEKISASANEVLDKMNVIIWSMNSGNDTVESLVSYIRSWVTEYLESTPVHCSISTPAEKDNREINGDKRRNIFLCVKETMNNILKHSGATSVSIDIHTNATLHITIADNGRGINMEQLRQFGNGLRNMKRRMESIGGTYTIANQNGTITTLELPL